MKKKYFKKTALLLGTVMILGSTSPAFAASEQVSCRSVPDDIVSVPDDIVYVSSEDDPSQDESCPEDVLGSVDTASLVTEEMCHSEYWYDKNEGFGSADKLLITPEEIKKLNYDALHADGTYMNDLENMSETYNALALKDSLAKGQIDSNENRLWGRKEFWADHVKITDPKSYCLKLYEAVSSNGYTEESREIQYAVAVKRTTVKSIPDPAYIGFSEYDGDDEIINSAMNINEPFIIKQKATVSGNDFYWGYSDNCTGWVLGDDLAICKDKDEWLDAWKVDPDADDFIVVTQNQIRLEPSFYDPYTSEVKLTFATILKSVPEEDMPDSFLERGSWNNHVVYLPTRDEEGKYVKRYALISQHYEVHEGYLDMTQAKLMDIAFNSLGDRYGWGGMLDSMDCSLFTRNVYKCFGVYLPRNTSWQQLIPGKSISFADMTDEQKLKAMYRMPAGTLFYFPGHTMIYTGMKDDMAYVISDTGSLADSVGDLTVKSMYSVILNPLSVRRRNGYSWLTNLSVAVLPISKENYDLVLKNISDDASGKNADTDEDVPETPDTRPDITPEDTHGLKKVTPMNGQTFAAASDTLALDTFLSSTKKLFISFTKVKGSGVDTLSVSCIKKSKITTKAPVKDVSFDKSVAKVKIDKKTSLAILTMKASGPVTFNMADGSVYTVYFTVETPKAQKAVKTLSISQNGIQELDVKKLFGTQIDGGKLTLVKAKQNNSTVSGNRLLVNTSQKNNLKVSYEYLDKRFKISINVK